MQNALMLLKQCLILAVGPQLYQLPVAQHLSGYLLFGFAVGLSLRLNRLLVYLDRFLLFLQFAEN